MTLGTVPSSCLRGIENPASWMVQKQASAILADALVLRRSVGEVNRPASVQTALQPGTCLALIVTTVEVWRCRSLQETNSPRVPYGQPESKRL